MFSKFRNADMENCSSSNVTSINISRNVSIDNANAINNNYHTNSDSCDDSISLHEINNETDKSSSVFDNSIQFGSKAKQTQFTPFNFDMYALDNN